MSNQNETPKPIMATDVMFEDGSSVALILSDRTMWLMALCRRVEDVEKRLSAMTPKPGSAEDVTPDATASEHALRQDVRRRQRGRSRRGE